MLPYLAKSARDDLALLGSDQVRSLVIGALRVVELRPPVRGDQAFAVVDFESNYAEFDANGVETAYFAQERWKLFRPAGASSRKPEGARVIGCLHCGAPLDKLVGGTCGYCGQVAQTGENDWAVGRIDVVARERRPPLLTTTTEEVGTSDPTLVAPDVQQRWRQLAEKDPNLDWGRLSARIEHIFGVFQVAWSGRDPKLMRPFLSDNLFQAQLYWLDAYAKQGLHNVTGNAAVRGLHLARVLTDAYFDAVTVRVYASSLDYTLDGAGKVVAGSRDAPRDYSEYWTFIRGSGPRDRSRTRADTECPNCGGGLDVNMAGHCAHCNAKITMGEFDWVLSRIEQDEAYSA
jgi:hypothetical protein